MHTVQDVWSCEYTQPPRAFTRTWATTRVKRVDMLYLGAYTEGGHYFGWALLRMGVITGFLRYCILLHITWLLSRIRRVSGQAEWSAFPRTMPVQSTSVDWTGNTQCISSLAKRKVRKCTQYMKYWPRTHSYVGQYVADTCPQSFAALAGIGQYCLCTHSYLVSISCISLPHCEVNC